jgi:hypothetical protein
VRLRAGAQLLARRPARPQVIKAAFSFDALVTVEGDLFARGRADRVERKALRNQRVYA